MANYTKTQVFANLRGGNADPAVFDTEFSAVQTALGTKADTDAPNTFLAPISVPAGATGTQVPNASDIPRIVFPVGTRMLFAQTTAPTGWAQDTTPGLNDRMLRLVNTPSALAGGTASPIAMNSTTGGHALIITEMPAHTHTYSQRQNAANTGNQIAGSPYSGALAAQTTGSTGGTGPGTNGVAHTHPMTWNPRYQDVIICVKQ